MQWSKPLHDPQLLLLIYLSCYTIILQRIIGNNCLCTFVRIAPELEIDCISIEIAFPNIDPSVATIAFIQPIITVVAK